MNTTAAVIVTYNRRALLKEGLSAVLSQTAACDVLVIDNHSTDGTGEMVKELVGSREETSDRDERDITYLNTGKNLGGSGGFSYGMREAVKRGYEYLWIMDDDCVPERDCLEKILFTGDGLKGDYGFLASRVVWTDGSLCSMNIPRDSLNHRLTKFGRGPEKIVIASFVSMLIPAERIREIGLPIKEFFIWVDDWEYARRLSKRYDCYLVPDSVAVHKTKNNDGADIIAAEGSSIDRYRYMYRNSVYFYRQEGLYGRVYLVGRTALHLIKVLLHSKHDKLRKCRLIIGSTLEGLRFNPEIDYVQ